MSLKELENVVVELQSILFRVNVCALLEILDNIPEEIVVVELFQWFLLIVKVNVLISDHKIEHCIVKY